MPGVDIGTILNSLEGSPFAKALAGLMVLLTWCVGMIFTLRKTAPSSNPASATPAPAAPDDDGDRRLYDELHRVNLRVERVEEGQNHLRRSLDSHHDTIERRLGDLQATADEARRHSRAAVEVLTQGRVLEFPDGRPGRGGSPL